MSNPKYTFLPWVSQGLGKYISQPAAGKSHSELNVDLISNGSTASVTIKVNGPGDVRSIDTRNIIKVHPSPHTGNFESNYLPFIEFYQDSFLWDYSPIAKQGDKIDPWLFLLVLEENEFTKVENPQGLSKLTFNTTDSVTLQNLFPPIDERWAWAHVHVNAEVNTIGSLDERLKSNPDFATCRLISPRKLLPNKRYEAFVIPSYEVGRKAGLGDVALIVGGDILDASWGNNQIEYPYYFSWSFGTGAEGDFESLVRALIPIKEHDPSVGFRPIDISGAKFGSLVKTPKDPDGIDIKQILLGGALKPLSNNPLQFDAETWKVEMSKLLNTDYIRLSVDNTTSDPIIVPPMYGHWHVLVHRLNKANASSSSIDEKERVWMHTLNLNPNHRTTAGVGVKVIKENQDKYLATAWEQIGEVLLANQLIKNSQAGIEIVTKWWDKHVINQSEEQIVAMVAPLLETIKCAQKQNLGVQLENSSTPKDSFSPVIRRLSNSRARVNKKFKKRSINRNVHLYTNIIEGIVKGHTTCPPKVTPIGKDNIVIDKQTQRPLTPCDLKGITVKPGSLTLPIKYFRWTKNNPTDPSNSNNPSSGRPIKVDEKDYINAWENLIKNLDCRPVNNTPPLFNVPEAVACIKSIMHPSITIKNRTLTKIDMVGLMDTITPIMAAPDYPEPMYKKLIEQSTEFMLPNLDKLPNNSISLMEVNQPFIEAYMVGLNYEMAGELLWNEYPTDQRGSYFRQFWDISKYVERDASLDEKQRAEKMKDIDFIHRWVKWTQLGDHRMTNNLPGATSSAAPLVLTIRGDILTRYPDAIIYAVKADTDGILITNASDETTVKYPIFSAKIEPDITFLGFELTESEVRGDGTPSNQGWFFCIKEPVTGPRFGMDVAKDNTSGPSINWNDLHWGHCNNDHNIVLDQMTFNNLLELDNATWGSNSADMAAILYQVPALVAVHGKHLLPQN